MCYGFVTYLLWRRVNILVILISYENLTCTYYLFCLQIYTYSHVIYPLFAKHLLNEQPAINKENEIPAPATL